MRCPGEANLQGVVGPEDASRTQGAHVPERDFQSSSDASKNLVFAMCHEISNLVAAIRLQAQGWTAYSE